jgi:Asp/Glu/hydantoin racemase
MVPITSPTLDAEAAQEFRSYAFPNTEVSVTHLDFGPASIECELDDAICVPDFLNKAKQAQKEGYDVVISDCFLDPAAASLKFAESLVSMKLKHSRLTYMPPPEKSRSYSPH